MMRNNCPIKALSVEIGTNVDITEETCRLCSTLTDNTILYKKDSLSIEYFAQCTMVDIAIGNTHYTVSRDNFIKMINQIQKRI